MPTLADIEAVVRVVETGSVSRAAENLHRVPSAVSNRILKLEDALGAPLFAREGKRMLPTAKGRVIHE